MFKMASVFCYIPNLIGYFRLTIIFVCWLQFDDYRVLLPLYTFQMLLDGIDGCVARRLNQCSAFGAWLDVLVDNIGRSVLWTGITKIGVFISCLEWTVFVCTHSLGPKWKDSGLQMPSIVSIVMSNGFYNVVGGYVIAGIHGLPLILYTYQHQEQIPYELNYIFAAGVVILIPARVLGSLVELWFIYVHITCMIQVEDNRKLNNDNLLTMDVEEKEHKQTEE